MDWLLILASLLLPVVPLFFFPGCVCCPTTCGPGCTDLPTSCTVTFTGFSNGGFCSVCSNYNTTYIINNSASGATCNFGRVAIAEFCPGQHTVLISLSVSGGDTILTVDNTINIGAFPNHTAVRWEKNLGTAPIVCNDIGTVSVPMTSTHEDQCAHDGSDCTVTL
jgi:hypothetical protein